MNFKINSRSLFTIIFKLKNDNLKTQDFSPLIERVLAGVYHMSVVDTISLKLISDCVKAKLMHIVRPN